MQKFVLTAQRLSTAIVVLQYEDMHARTGHFLAHRLQGICTLDGLKHNGVQHLPECCMSGLRCSI